MVSGRDTCMKESPRLIALSCRRAEAVRMTKQAASNIAAWKVCVQMGLLMEDEC